jgi:hypothetical protein
MWLKWLYICKGIHIRYNHIEFSDAAESSDSDEGELSIEDNVTAADFKPQSFLFKTKADVAMDMHSPIRSANAPCQQAIKI